MGDGSEDELLLATTDFREEVHGPWHQFVYENGAHVDLQHAGILRLAFPCDGPKYKLLVNKLATTL